MRKFYSDYVRHCTRYYFNVDVVPSSLNAPVKYNNYIAVSNIMDKYDSNTICILRQVYCSDNITKTVSDIARSRGCKTEALWYIIQSYEKNVALERGLLE